MIGVKLKEPNNFWKIQNLTFAQFLITIMHEKQEKLDKN